ncbi:MAG: type II toxin-antitoxin system ParD family antitoxin [Alphaproteobacteria bacterium]
MPTERLSVDLSADLATRVDELVKAGTYGSGSEVVEDALRLLRDRRRDRAVRLDEIRAELAAAAADPIRFTDDEVRRHFERRAALDAKRVR